jgi:predicted RNA-binding protein (TIGR00451 family)
MLVYSLLMAKFYSLTIMTAPFTLLLKFYTNVIFLIIMSIYFLTWLFYTLDPGFLPEVQVDRGAIKFVLSGANIMCPGLTSKGAKMDDVAIDKVVAIRAEGKEHAVAIGYTKMSTKDM